MILESPSISAETPNDLLHVRGIVEIE